MVFSSYDLSFDPEMRLCKQVRQAAGYTLYKMYKLLKKSSVQTYISLERTAVRLSLPDLIALEQIYTGACGKTHEEFWELVKKCAKTDQKILDYQTVERRARATPKDDDDEDAKS